MDLTTLARVRTLLAFGVSDTDKDAQLSDLIAAYSQTFERELDRHAMVASRTEVYRIKKGRRTLSLRGAPLSAAPTSLKYESTRDFTTSTAYVENDDFVVDLEQGLITFLFSPPLNYGYAEVIYTAGMAADTASFIAAYPAISVAVDMQVAYHWKRKDTPAGSKVVGGGSTNYIEQLDLLESSKRVINQYRRHYF